MHQGTDAEAVKRATEDLNASMLKIGEAVYGSGGAGAAGPDGAEPEEGTPEGTVEGEFREV